MSSISSAISAAVENLIEVVSGDVSEISKEAKTFTVEEWKAKQILKAVTVGAGSAAIPVYSYLTLPADLLATLRIMHRCATGVCVIKLDYADDETFAGILAVWSGQVNLDDNLAKQVAAKVAAASATTVGGQVGLKLSIKAFNLCASAMVAKKLGPKVAQKVASKLTAKLAAKATTRWIPFISAGVGGATNWWIVDGISDAAERYADFMKKQK